MNMKMVALAGAVAAALVGSGPATAFAATDAPVASTSPAVAPASTCLPEGHDDAWPVWVDGRPARDPGVTVWHNAQGWHVRVTHNSLRDRVFSGEIRTTGAIVAVHAVRLERNDSVQVGSGQHTLRFRFNNYGGTDGFDFATHCAPFLAFGFLSDGHVVAPSHISIGAGGHHPARDPFVITRRA
jgi:hypothetical protein